MIEFADITGNLKEESHDKRLESAVYFDCRNYSHRDRVDRVRQGALVPISTGGCFDLRRSHRNLPGTHFWKKVGLK